VTTKIGPSYQLVADDIRSRITSGEYEVGQKIPSTLKLREQYGASDTVVRRAVGDLEEAGILIGHPGKGVYVKAMPADIDSERVNVKVLSTQVAELRQQVRELADRAVTAQPADFARDLRDLQETVGRIEVNLIDLYGKMGHDYPQGGARDGAKAAARRGRSG
jgi:DNA-binding GntR family transcriptional regulator